MDLIERFRRVAKNVPVPQADPAARFGRWASDNAVPIGTLEVGRRYPITHASLFETAHGPTVKLDLAVDPSTHIAVFLPKRFTSIFQPADLQFINERTPPLYFVYYGRYNVGLAYVLCLTLKVPCDQ